MSLDKNGLYMVYNHSASPVSVMTRYESVLFDGSEDGDPVGKPMSFEDIAYINSNSQAFKIGLLQFDKADADVLHTELRNTGWKEIMTNEDIEDALLHPTADKMKAILSIKNSQYFDRIRGIYVHLINTDADISNKVSNLIKGRYAEFKKGILNTQLEVVDKIEPEDGNEKIAELEAKIKALTEMLSAKQEEPKPVTTTAKKPRSTKAK